MVYITPRVGITGTNGILAQRKMMKLYAGPCMGGHRRGLDYTPLFKFLLSKRGQAWDDVYSEAVKRLDRSEPIFWVVALPEDERQRYIRVGESSFFSGMYVDEEGTLQVVDPSLGPSSLVPFCRCCTHTLNGVPFTRLFVELGKLLEPEGNKVTQI